MKKSLKALQSIVEEAVKVGVAKLTEGVATLTINGVDIKRELRYWLQIQEQQQQMCLKRQ
ncbi:hypothetical protein Q7M_1162 (plasmid) [Borrelia crocidurae str. Achema]|uniref:Variable large protein n=1 Tax=Borrelia crocidurae (strain Achema) TaxID=1155096 RepID=I0FFA4_BORCA|nr:hypothetical protein Q7M_1162 [Borrelia crocidurae str. Achema]